MEHREKTQKTQPARSSGQREAVTPFSPAPASASAASSPFSAMARTERSPAVEPPYGVNSGAISTWRPPVAVGRYSIKNIIASGGMGQVYLAWDADLQRWVAMKFILGIEPDAAARARFMIEARATARVEHANVIRVYDVNEFEMRPYLVMEYLSGKTLDKLTKPVHWSHALELGVALACGLAAAHRHGVLHRDIKPDNAMLTDEGEVKLLDFGLAKLATRLSTPKNLPGAEPAQMSRPPLGAGGSLAPTVSTNTGIVGTPGYMAPESWLGCATQQSDVYSLGALLFDLCAGRTPYAEVAPHALSLAVQSRDAPLLTEVVPTVDSMFAAVVARCLSRAPGARFASGEDLFGALRELGRHACSGQVPGSISLRSGADDGRLAVPGGTTAARSMLFRDVGPLVVSVHSARAPSDEDWYEYLELCCRKMMGERIGVLVVTAGGGPTAKQRLAVRELLREGPVLTAVVTNPSRVREVTAMGWFNPGIRTFTSLGDALTCLRIDAPMAERVFHEVRTMQRELSSF